MCLDLCCHLLKLVFSSSWLFWGFFGHATYANSFLLSLLLPSRNLPPSLGLTALARKPGAAAAGGKQASPGRRALPGRVPSGQEAPTRSGADLALLLLPCTCCDDRAGSGPVPAAPRTTLVLSHVRRASHSWQKSCLPARFTLLIFWGFCIYIPERD